MNARLRQAAPRRYAQLARAVHDRRCATLVEVGTWNGNRAKELAAAALRRASDVTYHGFDLFESLTDEDFEAEMSKRPPSQAAVEANLARFRRRLERRRLLTPWRSSSARFALHAGYTRDSLPAFRAANPDFRADFVFIDGGHSIDTIANDWEHCSAMLALDGVVFLDDFYGDDGLAQRFGCNSLIRRLSQGDEWRVEVLPVTDTFPEIGTIQIVGVRRRPI